MKKKILLILMFVLTSFNVMAAPDAKSFTFNGNQTFKNISLEDIETQTQYQTQQVPSTCFQTVPYQQQVCNYQTAYKNQCHTTQPTQQCNWIPGKQVCTQQPGGQQCHMVPGKQVCKTNPPKEVCRIVNGRRVCKMVPGGSSCHQQPPHQVCTQKPPKQVCHQQPGHNQCHTVPGQYVCKQVPYQKQVCHTETKYKQESYTCYKSEQVPVTVETFRTSADLNFDFIKYPSTNNLRVRINAELQDKKLKITAEDLTHSGLAIFTKESIDKNKNGSHKWFNGDIKVKVFTTNQLLNKEEYSHIRAGVRDLKMNESNTLVILTDSVLSPESFGLKLVVKDQTTGDVLFKGMLTDDQYNHVFDQYQTKTKVNLRSLIPYISSGTRILVKAILSVKDDRFDLINEDDVPSLTAQAKEFFFWN